MRTAGYLVNLPGGISGEKGQFFDYVLAADGIYVRSETPLLRATIRIAEAQIRGLDTLAEKVELVHGKIPSWMGRFALNVLRTMPYEEAYLAIIWDNGYHLRTPHQEKCKSSVSYVPIPNKLVDIHSHGTMKAFFSEVDDQDEQGMALYIVVGEMRKPTAAALARVGIYGYFRMIDWEDVFEL